MGRHTNTHMSISRALRVLLSVCLVVGLAPALALADTTVGVKTEIPSQVNETVAISPDVQDGVELVDGEVPVGTQVEQELLKPEATPSADAQTKPTQITTDVVLGATSDTQTETLLVDGLTYLVNYASESATLTGWYGNAPTGNLSIPSEIADGKNTFKVQFAGGGDFLGLNSSESQNPETSQVTQNKPTTKTPDTSVFKDCPNLTSVTLPSTITEIGKSALAQCPSLRSIHVSPQNTTYASYEGILYTKGLSTLLSIPEGMEHTAYLPDTTDTVPAGAFSHSAQLTSVSIGESSTVYSTENGILYTKDKATLVAVPAGYGDSVVIPESVTTIAPQAFAGCTLKSIVSLGTIASIDPTAFSDSTKAEAIVVLPGSSTYESQKAIWQQAGFTHFQEPAKPGDITTPDDSQEKSGFTYELLDDYTLSVSWKGNSSPDTDLVIPVSASLSGATYRVSTVASHAFENHDSITSVVIPSSISLIQDSAFKGCTQLASISLSEGLTSIRDSAFEDTALQQVVLPKSLTTLGEYTFAHNKALTSVVALSTITSVASTTLDGCSQVSILTPYQEDGLYSWTPGISALGNHIEPYGFTSSDESLTLETGQSKDLFDQSQKFVPASCELVYSYPATSVSVDENGIVKGKASGAADVVATIMLDGVELARGLRSVAVTNQVAADTEEGVFGSKDTQGLRTSPLPLSLTMLSLDGNEIAPRGKIAGDVSGGCTWDITDGKLTIRPTDGKAGTLDPFDDPPWLSNAASITSVDIQDGVSGGTSVRRMFWQCSNLATLDLTYFNTSNVENMEGMFSTCSNLTTLNLSNLDTSRVSNMAWMFAGCLILEKLDLSRLNTSKVTTMYSMFQDCDRITAFDLPNFNTSKVTDMAAMFRACDNLTSINISNFDTSNVTTMNRMFDYCINLPTLDLSNLDATKVTDMEYMFSTCSKLGTLNLKNFKTANVTNINSMFYNCPSLTALDLSSFVTTNVTNMGGMFAACSKLSSLDLSNFNTSNVISMNGLFMGCTDLAALNISGFDTAKVTSMNRMFNSCSNLTELDLSNLDATKVTDMDYMFSSCQKLTTLNMSNFRTENITITRAMFWSCISLSALDLSGFNTAKVTNMDSMFADCTKLVDIKFSPNFKADNVTTMVNMFNACTSLGTLDLSSFNTENVLDMAGMFCNCSSLTNLDLPSNFKTVNVTKMNHMFAGCSSLATLDLASFDTRNVTSMFWMFQGCSSLLSLNLSNFDTANVTDMNFMFNGCAKIADLNVSSFNMAKVTSTDNMFAHCLNLTSLDLSNFNTINVTNMAAMFYNCPELVTLNLSSKFVTNNVTTMDGMFHACLRLSSLDLSSFDTSKVNVMSWMFFRCDSLTALDLSTFDTNSVTNSENMFGSTPQLATVKIGNTYTLPLPQKIGASVEGANYTGKWIAQSNDTLHSFDEDFKNKSDTYTAQQDRYVLSFNTQGGSQAPVFQLLDIGAKATEVAAPTKAGHTFVGWYTEAACINAWDFTTNVMPTRNVVLYAGWLSNTCIVTFAGNGGEPATTTKTVNRGSSLGADTPVIPQKTGHRFIDWYTDATGGTVYNFNTAVTSDITLWAHWEAIPYTLSFDSQGGTPNPSPQTVRYGSVASPVSDPIRPGYTFNGWFTEAGGLGNHWDIATTTMPANDQTLFAHWTAKPYTIFFDANGVVGSMGSQSMTYGVKEALKPNTLVAPAGSRFTGWNTRADGLGDSYADKAEVLDLAAGSDSITLFAQWTENTYTIEFMPNPGTHPVTPDSMPKVANIKYSQVLNLPQSLFSSSDGYVFAYWTKDQAGTGAQYLDKAEVSKLGGATRDGELVRLYAQWQGAPYTITYDPTTSDVTGAIDPQPCRYGAWETLASGGFTKPNSVLVGWATKKADAELGYADYTLGDQVLDLAQGSDAVTLYAVWTEQINVASPINPTIKIDAQGKPTADTTTYFESNTSKPVNVTKAVCSPITGEQGTKAVFPQETQWPDIAITLKTTSSPTNRLPLSGLTLPIQGFSVPAKSGSIPGKLPVSVNLAFLDTVDISYNPDTSCPIAQVTFVFEMGA